MDIPTLLSDEGNLGAGKLDVLEQVRWRKQLQRTQTPLAQDTSRRLSPLAL
jgi:hypothetical protein